jgi:5'-nucleotidase
LPPSPAPPCVTHTTITHPPIFCPSRCPLQHFNDVYTIEPGNFKPGDPTAIAGGAARFASKLSEFKAANPLVLFSGDAFNPSSLSQITKGKHMIPVLNQLGVHVACMGNHDLDFGLDNYVELVKGSTFPWLLSNVYDKATGQPFANSPTTHTIVHEGIKIGFVGLVESDWLDTLGAVDPSTIEYRDMFKVGSELATKLREEGCAYIMAITHSRLPNDELTAEKCPEIDMVLGGHDHE